MLKKESSHLTILTGLKQAICAQNKAQCEQFLINQDSIDLFACEEKESPLQLAIEQLGAPLGMEICMLLIFYLKTSRSFKTYDGMTPLLYTICTLVSLVTIPSSAHKASQHEATIQQRIDLCLEIIRACPEWVGMASTHNKTPLLYAAYIGETSLLTALYAHGALAGIGTIVDTGDDDRKTVLSMALSAHHFDLFITLARKPETSKAFPPDSEEWERLLEIAFKINRPCELKASVTFILEQIGLRYKKPEDFHLKLNRLLVNLKVNEQAQDSTPIQGAEPFTVAAIIKDHIFITEQVIIKRISLPPFKGVELETEDGLERILIGFIKLNLYMHAQDLLHSLYARNGFFTHLPTLKKIFILLLKAIKETITDSSLLGATSIPWKLEHSDPVLNLLSTLQRCILPETFEMLFPIAAQRDFILSTREPCDSSILFKRACDLPFHTSNQYLASLTNFFVGLGREGFCSLLQVDPVVNEHDESLVVIQGKFERLDIVHSFTQSKHPSFSVTKQDCVDQIINALRRWHKNMTYKLQPDGKEFIFHFPYEPFQRETFSAEFMDQIMEEWSLKISEYVILLKERLATQISTFTDNFLSILDKSKTIWMLCQEEGETCFAASQELTGLYAQLSPEEQKKVPLPTRPLFSSIQNSLKNLPDLSAVTELTQLHTEICNNMNTDQLSFARLQYMKQVLSKTTLSHFTDEFFSNLKLQVATEKKQFTDTLTRVERKINKLLGQKEKNEAAARKKQEKIEERMTHWQACSSTIATVAATYEMPTVFITVRFSSDAEIKLQNDQHKSFSVSAETYRTVFKNTLCESIQKSLLTQASREISSIPLSDIPSDFQLSFYGTDLNPSEISAVFEKKLISTLWFMSSSYREEHIASLITSCTAKLQQISVIQSSYADLLTQVKTAEEQLTQRRNYCIEKMQHIRDQHPTTTLSPLLNKRSEAIIFKALNITQGEPVSLNLKLEKKLDQQSNEINEIKEELESIQRSLDSCHLTSDCATNLHTLETTLTKLASKLQTLTKTGEAQQCTVSERIKTYQLYCTEYEKAIVNKEHALQPKVTSSTTTATQKLSKNPKTLRRQQEALEQARKMTTAQQHLLALNSLFNEIYSFIDYERSSYYCTYDYSKLLDKLVLLTQNYKQMPDEIKDFIDRHLFPQSQFKTIVSQITLFCTPTKALKALLPDVINEIALQCLDLASIISTYLKDNNCFTKKTLCAASLFTRGFFQQKGPKPPDLSSCPRYELFPEGDQQPWFNSKTI